MGLSFAEFALELYVDSIIKCLTHLKVNLDNHQNLWQLS